MGLPQVEGMRALRPGEIVRCRSTVYGFSDAPAEWHEERRPPGGSGLAASRKPVSVPTWIKKCCGDYGNLPAYGVKGGDGKWTLTNYKEYYKQMKTVSSRLYCPKTMICTSCSHAACCSAV